MALVTFIVEMLAVGLSFVGVPAVSFVAGILAFPIIFLNQFAVIVELNGGLFQPRGTRRDPRITGLAFEQAKKLVPAKVRVAIGVLTVLFGANMINSLSIALRSGTEPPPPAGAFALVAALFSLVHYAAFQYVLPEWSEILKRVTSQLNEEDKP